MKRPFSLLILSGDGTRVKRVTVPRWVAFGTVGTSGLIVGVILALSGQFVYFKAQSSQVPGLRQQVKEQVALNETFQKRLVGVRGEIDEWKGLFAKMWEPYGPDEDPAQAASGVGGPAPVPPAAAGPGASLGQELDLLTASVTEEGPRLRELEKVVSKNARIMAALPLRWPARGPVNSEYGSRSNPWGGAAKEHHGGIDIGVPHGEPIKAPAPGVVVLAGPRGDYGNSVTLDHGNDVRSLYGHMSKLLVQTGNYVEKGQVIGLAGSTGRSTGTHLHYEVRVKGRPVNPRSFLWE